MIITSNSKVDTMYDLPFGAIHQQFRSVAAQNPHSIALVQEERTYTYAELLQRALRFAAICTRAGVTKNTLVAVDPNRSLETIVSLLGILFAGGAYVPVDICDKASAALFARHDIRFFAGKSLNDCSQKGISLLSFDEITTKKLPQVFDLPGERCSFDDPAYVLFTSGSTGARKGVVVPHRGVIRLVNGQHFVPMGSDERVLLHSPLTFDASTFELWSALLHGATVILAPQRSLSVEDFQTLILQHGITTLWLTAGIFHLIARHSAETFATLRHLIVGGDVIHADLFARVKQSFPQLRLVNGYGPTENTTFTACYVATDHFSGGKVPIGEPIVGTSIYIVDENGMPVSEGTPGELATGGAGVALGYLNDPALTSKRFLADPSQPNSNARVYLTGDLVRLVDGQLDFLGRKDSEVKLSGQRVQLDEVEQEIAKCALVSACSLIVLDDDLQNKLLVAFIVWKATPAEEELRAELKDRLPLVAIPRIFRAVEQLPLTENGKVDRSLLKKTFQAESAPRAETIVPNEVTRDRHKLLEKVADIWKRVLHRQEIDTKRNFFDLGGDSLSLMIMQAELQKLSPDAPTIIELFSLPHVESIADFLLHKSSIQQPPVRNLVQTMALDVLHGYAGE